MLSIVFDLVYSTFWSSRSERERHAEPLLRVQVVVKRLAGVLFQAPAADGSTPRQVRECVELFVQEVERLGERHEIGKKQLFEAREKLEEMRLLAEKMAAHCAEMEAEEAAQPL